MVGRIPQELGRGVVGRQLFMCVDSAGGLVEDVDNSIDCSVNEAGVELLGSVGHI